MGQLFSSEEELSQVKEALGSLLLDAMSEGGAVPDLRVLHPVLLSGHDDESLASRDRLQDQLQQLQSDMGTRAPTYLRDLIGRLSAFSDEPRLAGLVGLVVTMVMDMAYSSSKQSSGVKGKVARSSSSCQKVLELQEVMEEYLKRCRISLYDKSRLIQDSIRLEAQLSLTLTQLRTSLLGGDCNSSSLRHWASGAAFHTHMLIHLARLEGKAEPLCARAALGQYREDLSQIIPAYRRYKSNMTSVAKCRGGSLSSELPEEGAMTGLTVTDRETGQSVTISLSNLEAELERRMTQSGSETSSLNLELVTSDQYAEAYLDRLFSEKGPVAKLQNFFTEASENLTTVRTCSGWKNKTGVEQNEGAPLKERLEGVNEGLKEGKDQIERTRGGGETEKLSIVETQQEDRVTHSATSA